MLMTNEAQQFIVNGKYKKPLPKMLIMSKEELLFWTCRAVLAHNRECCSMIQEVFLNPPF